MQCIPLRGLKDTAAALCQEPKEPIVVTKNGYTEMIIMSPDVYEMRHRPSIDESMLRAEADVQSGRVTPAADVMQRMKEKYGLHD